MRNPLAKKVVEIEPSGIRKFFDVVNEMKDLFSGKGKDILYIKLWTEGIKRRNL